MRVRPVMSDRATQHSWRRAADNLEAQGQIQEDWVWPFSPEREIVAVRNQIVCGLCGRWSLRRDQEGCQAAVR